MKFWDSSAVVPLLVEQSASERMRDLFRADDQMVVWWSTRVECWSAFSRLHRDGLLTSDHYDQVLANLQALQDAWLEISPTEEVRSIARRIVRLHPLRATDALQLAAAVAWATHYEFGDFVSLDERLRAGARSEGFSVV